MTTQNSTTQNQPAAEQATGVRWKIDPAHSSVLFSVKHMGFFEVTGKFTEFDAILTQKGADFEKAVVEATVKTKSVDTANSDRDNHLRTADFFDAEKYPEITFKSKTVEKTGENVYAVNGELTIRGVAKPIQLAAQYSGQGVDPWGNLRMGFKASGLINRYDYGLQWNQTLETGGLLVSKNVDITLNLQFVKQK